MSNSFSLKCVIHVQYIMFIKELKKVHSVCRQISLIKLQNNSNMRLFTLMENTNLCVLLLLGGSQKGSFLCVKTPLCTHSWRKPPLKNLKLTHCVIFGFQSKPHQTLWKWSHLITLNNEERPAFWKARRDEEMEHVTQRPGLWMLKIKHSNRICLFVWASFFLVFIFPWMFTAQSDTGEVSGVHAD